MKSYYDAFTLIEVLIVVAVLGGISIILAQSFFAIFRANTKAEIIRDIKQSGNFSLNAIERIVRENAKVISSCNGEFQRELIVLDFNGNQTRFHCVQEVINDVFVTRLASTSGNLTQYLTPRSFTMGGRHCESSSLNFSCLRNSYGRNVVRISFRLSPIESSQQNSGELTLDFQTTVSPRN